MILFFSIPAFLCLQGRLPLFITVNNYYGGGKTVDDMYNRMMKDIEPVEIKITNGEEVLKTVKSSDFCRYYYEKKELEKLTTLKHHMEGIIISKEVILPVLSDIDEDKMNQLLEELNGTTSSENAYIACDLSSSSYIIIPDKTGTIFDKEEVRKKLEEAVKKCTDTSVDISSAFITAGVTADNKELVEKKDSLNKIFSTEILYKTAENEILLTSKEYFNWIEKDEKGIPYMDGEQYAFKEELVDEFIQTLCNTYDTLGKEKEFLATNGETVLIETGTYGWEIDKEKEKEQLKQEILSGEKIEREPVWKNKAVGFGLKEAGNTYVEISLDEQHLWYYVDGNLTLESDIVSGNKNKNTESDKGFWFLKSKTEGKWLVGPTWRSWVDYWMPYNNSAEGLHDASWRNKFGGNIYKSNGSHGCVNLPSEFAKEIFEKLEVGTPIIIY